MKGPLLPPVATGRVWGRKDQAACRRDGGTGSWDGVLGTGVEGAGGVEQARVLRVHAMAGGGRGRPDGLDFQRPAWTARCTEEPIPPSVPVHTAAAAGAPAGALAGAPAGAFVGGACLALPERTSEP